MITPSWSILQRRAQNRIETKRESKEVVAMATQPNIRNIGNTSMAKNMPEAKFRAGAVSATVWKNAGQKEDGQPTEYRSISIERNYMDKKTNTWQTTSSMRLNDLPKAVVVLQKAYEHLVLKEQDKDSGEIA
jgi:hypothetical protein